MKPADRLLATPPLSNYPPVLGSWSYRGGKNKYPINRNHLKDGPATVEYWKKILRNPYISVVIVEWFYEPLDYPEDM